MENSAGNVVVGDEAWGAALLALVIGLSSRPGDARVVRPALLIGVLPDSLPVVLPFPDGSRVLGTLVWGPQHTTVLAEASHAPAHVQSFYRERMRAAGWAETAPGPQPGGFTHTGMEGQAGSHFCSGDSTAPAALVIRACSRAYTGRTEVRLDLDVSGQGCLERAHLLLGTPHEAPLFPPLTPPEGASQFGCSVTRGNERASCSATLATAAAEIGELAGHYAGQLTGAGWTRLDGGLGGPCAWSTWTFADPYSVRWHGIFLLVSDPVSGHRRRQYALQVRAFRDGPAGVSQGW